jgi:hypothetical protein
MVVHENEFRAWPSPAGDDRRARRATRSDPTRHVGRAGCRHRASFNEPRRDIRYLPEGFCVRVGNRLYYQSISDAPGLLPQLGIGCVLSSLILAGVRRA